MDKTQPWGRSYQKCSTSSIKLIDLGITNIRLLKYFCKDYRRVTTNYTDTEAKTYEESKIQTNLCIEKTIQVSKIQKISF